MDGEIRYCTTADGVRIAYRVTGEGPAVVIVPTPLESFVLAYEIPEYRSLFERMCDGYTRIDFDGRGVGLSQRDFGELTLDSLAFDLEAVLTSAKMKRAAIWAYGSGVSRAIAFAARHPKMVTSLILYGGSLRSEDSLSENRRKGLRTIMDLAVTSLPMAARIFSGSADSNDPEHARATNLWDRSATEVDRSHLLHSLRSAVDDG